MVLILLFLNYYIKCLGILFYSFSSHFPLNNVLHMFDSFWYKINASRYLILENIYMMHKYDFKTLKGRNIFSDKQKNSEILNHLYKNIAKII